MPINTRQRRMSAIYPGCIWMGVYINPLENGFTESNRRAALSTYGGISFLSGLEPFSTVMCRGTLSDSIIFNRESSLYDNSLLSDDANIKNDVAYESINSADFITDTLHVNKSITGADVHTYDLSNYSMTMLGLSIPKSLYSVKSITIYNKGDDDLPVVISGPSGFKSILGSPTAPMYIKSSGCFHMNRINSEWEVSSGNRILSIGDGVNTNTSYELVILGRKNFE